MAHPYLVQLQDLVDNVDVGDSVVVCKHFFSGAAAYLNGKIIASLSPNGLAFKLTTSRCAEVLSDGIAIPLRYFDKSSIKKDYVLFPDVDKLGNREIANLFRECVLNSTQCPP